MIDIIIPVYNEEFFLQTHKDYYYKLSRRYPLLFVDGGSADDTVRCAESFGKVLRSKKGRAVQKNFGACNSQNKYILFLHVDMVVDADAIHAAVNALEQGASAGCFQMSILGPDLVFRVFEGLVNMRARLWRVTDGDLGLFIRRDVFEELGGFPEEAVMEDVLMGCLLRGKAFKMVKKNIGVSPRKWRERGFWNLIIEYTRIYWSFYFRKKNLEACKV